MMIGKLRLCVAGISLSLLGACSTVDIAPAPSIAAEDVIAVVPLMNYTETPEAGRRAASIAFGILQVQGHRDVLQPVPRSGGDLLFGDAGVSDQTRDLEWARQADARYALIGSVQEWRYKVGVDGEPAVGLSFHLVDLDTGATLWTATGSRSGWSRSSLAGVGQALARELLEPLRVRSR